MFKKTILRKLQMSAIFSVLVMIFCLTNVQAQTEFSQSLDTVYLLQYSDNGSSEKTAQLTFEGTKDGGGSAYVTMIFDPKDDFQVKLINKCYDLLGKVLADSANFNFSYSTTATVTFPGFAPINIDIADSSNSRTTCSVVGQ